MSPTIDAAMTAASVHPKAGVVLTIFFAAFLFAIFAVAFSYAWFSRS